MNYLRPVRDDDIPLIYEWWRKHHSGSYGVPARNNVLDDRIMVAGETPVGYGMVKLFAEGVIVMDKDAPLSSRAEGLIKGINHALDVVRMTGLEQFHILTDDPHFIEVLKKHWGFRIAPGTFLFKEVDRG